MWLEIKALYSSTITSYRCKNLDAGEKEVASTSLIKVNKENNFLGSKTPNLAWVCIK